MRPHRRLHDTDCSSVSYARPTPHFGWPGRLYQPTLSTSLLFHTLQSAPLLHSTHQPPTECSTLACRSSPHRFLSIAEQTECRPYEIVPSCTISLGIRQPGTVFSAFLQAKVIIDAGAHN
ncbi:unnamed protein product [Protopolystoma xenopodis]|uniref:Uncharacterized protein n=1 Tax=Protopolystoma xenopodis TaxID=117903 RepID=A0A448WLK7_9PLAT|nr:unnamed protein product [Protopolystoma xenopodis]